ncbi:hypothetical protein CF123_18100 [Aeromonas veronii]|uniref:Uncharacterized protein n=1 Tax=Aeromonas veronii TaxID=654 RepID=A0AAX2UPY8_AERVE|nr:hypothetical protein [Aeromonas veronii]TND52030.1 hypothetical protein CF123_18100 [Aeromonas veronii]
MDILDRQTLAAAVLGLTDDQLEAIMNGDEDFDTPLMERFGVDLDAFGGIAEALILLTAPVGCDQDGNQLHAFVRNEGTFLRALATEKGANVSWAHPPAGKQIAPGEGKRHG